METKRVVSPIESVEKQIFSETELDEYYSVGLLGEEIKPSREKKALRFYLIGDEILTKEGVYEVQADNQATGILRGWDDGSLEIGVCLPIVLTKRNLEILFITLEHEYIHQTILELENEEICKAFDESWYGRNYVHYYLLKKDGFGYDVTKRMDQTKIDYESIDRDWSDLSEIHSSGSEKAWF